MLILQKDGDWRVIEDSDGDPVLHRGGQEDSKRAAIRADDDLQKLVAGDGVTLAAVPAASWQPTTARMRQRDPILDLG